MTPERRCIDWLFIVTWLTLAVAALAFALVIGAGVVWLVGQVWRAFWFVAVPWVQVNGDQLAIGLALGCFIAAVVALALEEKR